MIFVFFVYGLAFFLMGMAILIFPKKDSEFKLVHNIWLLAGFGIAHGINEWLDMFMLIEKPEETSAVHLLRLLILAVSYFFLVLFGTRIIAENKKKVSGSMRILTAAICIAWVAAMISSKDFSLRDVWTRYLLGLPGSLLTAYALILQISQFKEMKPSAVLGSLRICIVAFICYGVFSGLIVRKAGFFPASFLNYDSFREVAGFPIQVFRSVCAVLIAYAMFRILSIFEWETKGKIKSLFDDIRDAYSKLKESERTKDSLTHMIVHDQNNLLMAISGELELLQLSDAGRFTEEQRGDIKQGLLATTEMKQMIGNLLDISKMEDGKLALRYETFSLSVLLKEVVNEMNIVAAAENKKISIEVAGDMPDIKADRGLTRRIIANLISNAIKHTSVEGGVTVIAFYDSGKREFCVRVKDAGEGIPREYLTKIFEKFVQLEDKAVTRGHGLGLTFCKMAVEAHGGKVWAEGERGQGSIFCFVLPEIGIRTP